MSELSLCLNAIQQVCVCPVYHMELHAIRAGKIKRLSIGGVCGRVMACGMRSGACTACTVCGMRAGAYEFGEEGA